MKKKQLKKIKNPIISLNSIETYDNFLSLPIIDKLSIPYLYSRFSKEYMKHWIKNYGLTEGKGVYGGISDVKKFLPFSIKDLELEMRTNYNNFLNLFKDTEKLLTMSVSHPVQIFRFAEMIRVWEENNIKSHILGGGLDRGDFITSLINNEFDTIVATPSFILSTYYQLKSKYKSFTPNFKTIILVAEFIPHGILNKLKFIFPECKIIEVIATTEMGIIGGPTLSCDSIHTWESGLIEVIDSKTFKPCENNKKGWALFTLFTRNENINPFIRYFEGDIFSSYPCPKCGKPAFIQIARDLDLIKEDIYSQDIQNLICEYDEFTGICSLETKRKKIEILIESLDTNSSTVSHLKSELEKKIFDKFGLTTEVKITDLNSGLLETKILMKRQI